ncbi:type I DNA topoisomerase [Persicimonas caeni]|uniref:DNA topoisomerase 1 n=1 Tax=Persicimonas caeni TaxID=2292766 RepID=A0A4Y6PT82_PERCE|nr:type I DNA topoisomerase [Persicimonas caeni]QDG51521.1 type I DNA topoisomerase [Persicimonas caeni]QED32742.1 type I DNA topoisomerase [Persicimonas caeni]
MSKLVIVESPAKAKTIEKYLPGDFRVLASLGHVRDLPDKKSQLPKKYQKEDWASLGVDIEHEFEPIYVVKDKRSKKAISELKSELKKAEELYLATDEDREGEAISWHLVELLNPKVPTRRMVFHEITKSAIQEALEQTRDIDVHLVQSQEARRILDRLVGFPLSGLLWKKIAPKLSAGRVQSVAVRVLVERERERRAFRTGTYWDLKAALDKDGSKFDADLVSIDGTRIASGKDFDKDTGKIAEGKDVLLVEEEMANELLDKLEGLDWRVQSVKKRQYTTSPKAPFITSTLQQEASRKLGMSASQTMSIAQRLYESGKITYMRTDSVNLSKQAVTAARKAAREQYGDDYVRDEPRIYSSKSKGAQEAHEAIRPAGEEFVSPKKSGLSGRELKLYDLIYKRTLACQMADAKKTSTSVELVVDVDGKEVVFRANGLKTDFAGFISAYLESSDDPEAELADQEKHLPPMKEGDGVDCTDVEPIRHETKPPARYTEASLVKVLEEAGVGRPSTYASIMSTITRDDRYARKQGKTLIPTYTAFAVVELLEDYFPGLVDLQFTARMEDDLDEIARGEGSKVEYLHQFYRDEGAFDDQIKSGEEEIDNEEARVVHLSDFPATLRVGRFGPYAEWEADGETKKIDVPEDIPPADLTLEHLEELYAEREQWPKALGEDPETGKTVFLNNGRYGPYVQLGERIKGEKKPKTASVPPNVELHDVDLDQALTYLSLPRVLGEHPEDGKPIEAAIGRYGPYVRHKRDYRNLDNVDKVFTITYEEAMEILSQPKNNRRRRKVLKELGKDPESGKEINVLDGRYGPYVKLGKTNASLPKGVNPEDMTLEKALELIKEKQK